MPAMTFKLAVLLAARAAARRAARRVRLSNYKKYRLKLKFVPVDSSVTNATGGGFVGRMRTAIGDVVDPLNDKMLDTYSTVATVVGFNPSKKQVIVMFNAPPTLLAPAAANWCRTVVYLNSAVLATVGTREKEDWEGVKWFSHLTMLRALWVVPHKSRHKSPRRLAFLTTIIHLYRF
jgi:hypothetical protein